MSKTYVLDSYAVLALLAEETGAEQVSGLLRQAQAGQIDVFMTWVNVGEVAYIVERRWGRSRLCQILVALEATGLQIVSVERVLALAAAGIQARHPLVYADSFAAALAAQRGATLVTGDPEFRALEGMVPILWLGRSA